jgi:hypothetical protein
MSVETAVSTIGLLLCIAVAMTLGSIKRAQPATVIARKTRAGAVRPRRQL